MLNTTGHPRLPYCCPPHTQQLRTLLSLARVARSDRLFPAQISTSFKDSNPNGTSGVLKVRQGSPEEAEDSVVHLSVRLRIHVGVLQGAEMVQNDPLLRLGSLGRHVFGTGTTHNVLHGTCRGLPGRTTELLSSEPEQPGTGGVWT